MTDTTSNRRTSSDLPVNELYTDADLEAFEPDHALGRPGHFPYTRGVHEQMYRQRLWTMRQYAGFGTAAATNQRFKFLLDAGQTGLSCAFDLPTQMGYDSDHPRSEGEVGKVGVAIDSLDDMRILLGGLPLDTVTTSMTINSTASSLLLMYQLVAEEQEMRAKLQHHEIDETEEHRRLRAVEVALDQCWDLLRQRRALRETGQDPNQAGVRPAGTVEGYLG